MKIIRTIEEIRDSTTKFKLKKASIGFVPTMGFLHSGHLELIRQAKNLCDIVVVSVFVNPTQFNDTRDFDLYPQDEEGDIQKCRNAKVDVYFSPKTTDVFPTSAIKMQFFLNPLDQELCGKFRPGHFSGVMWVLAKLFNWINPDKVFMGKKDFQQFRIVQEFSNSLAFPIEVIGVETIREENGVALSSRNARLSAKAFEEVQLIPRMWQLANKILQGGEKNRNAFLSILKDFLLTSPLITIEYLEVVDTNTLLPKEITGKFLVAVAIFCDGIRLIDNKEWNLS